MTEGQDSLDSTNEKSHSHSTVLWIIAAVSLTGLLTGWLTGLSESPVAGILLPLLFTLIAGAGGFHFSNISDREILETLLERPVCS